MNVLYVADTETTGTDERIHDVIELSLLRLSDNAQKTFYIQPVNWDTIEDAALRVNGHKLEDLKRGFRLEEDGTRTLYLKPMAALVEIENFLMEDLVTAMERALVGHNIGFDKAFLLELWRRCGQAETYPFGRMYLDTMQIAFFLDYVNDSIRDGGYHLGGVVKAWEVKKEKAHRADADVRMTKDVFLKMVGAAKKMAGLTMADLVGTPAPAVKKTRTKKVVIEITTPHIPTEAEMFEALADQQEVDDMTGKLS